ncbi:hypothetical protein [Helicobacter pylori]|uniref:hypothetical protein n=1 Tax=Helicobacter pylori TaxID=210 RepID=UPI000C30E6DB|nr:hypothetical protein [Helicobacter pylori]
MKIKAIMLGLVLIGGCLFGEELLKTYEYRNDSGVKQYRFGTGNLKQTFDYIDTLNPMMFNYANINNGRSIFKIVVDNAYDNNQLRNKVLQDEADAYMTQKEVSALQLQVMRLKQELTQLKQAKK